MLLLMDGMTYPEISAREGVPDTSLRRLISRAFFLLGVRNAVEAGVVMVERGWAVEDSDIPPPSPGMRERLGLDRTGPLWWLHEPDVGEPPLDRLMRHMAEAQPGKLIGDRE